MAPVDGTHGGPGRRFVRQFALTQGRTRSLAGKDLPLDTLVQATSVGQANVGMLGAEQALVIERCRTPIAVAEIAAHLHTHLGVARVIVSDMFAQDLVAISTSDFDGDGPDLGTLERLLDDLQAL
jgi:hypothetical protein